MGYNNDGMMSNCYSIGSVSGIECVGGLVGYSDDGRVSNCCTKVSVLGTDYVGGLVGANPYRTLVTDCYSLGSVSGSRFVGGLIGINYYIVIYCYSSASVSGTMRVGGLMGFSGSDDLVENSFWDVQTSGQTSSFGGTGKTTAQMQDINTYLSAGWNLNTIWTICNGKGYPRLRWENTECDGSP